MKARFENGVYRDCKWCRGKGCISCAAEADAEYNRQFPDGPQPIMTIPLKKGQSGMDVLREIFPDMRIVEAKELE